MLQGTGVSKNLGREVLVYCFSTVFFTLNCPLNLFFLIRFNLLNITYEPCNWAGCKLASIEVLQPDTEFVFLL